jgi:hypothetical protein
VRGALMVNKMVALRFHGRSFALQNCGCRL